MFWGCVCAWDRFGVTDVCVGEGEVVAGGDAERVGGGWSVGVDGRRTTRIFFFWNIGDERDVVQRGLSSLVPGPA